MRGGALEPPEERRDCDLMDLSLYGEMMKWWKAIVSWENYNLPSGIIL